MTAAPAYAGELERLSQGWALELPVKGAREWEWFYALPRSDQAWIRGSYCSAAKGSLSPNDIADQNGYGLDIDQAMDRWLQAARLERRRYAKELVAATSLDPLANDWAAEEEQAERDALLMGPHELAAETGLTVANVLQRRCRGKWSREIRFPEADFNVSNVPIWERRTLRLAGIVT